MKIDMKWALSDRKGEPIKKPSKDGVEPKLTTLEDILAEALSEWDAEKTRLSAEEKYSRYKILKDLSNPDKEWKAEDLALMKKAVGDYPWFLPWVLGVVWDYIDQVKDSKAA